MGPVFLGQQFQSVPNDLNATVFQNKAPTGGVEGGYQKRKGE